MWDKHSKEEYDNRIMGANATNAGPNVTNVEANATNVEPNATIVGANATIVGAKKEKKTAEKGQILRKNDYHLQNERKSLGRAFCTA